MRVRWIAITLAMALLTAACGDSAESETVDGPSSSEGDAEAVNDEQFNLTAATYLPDHGPIGEAFQWWMDEVEARTDGQVAFSAHYNESLLEATELRDGTVDGRAQVTLTSPSTYHVEDFALTDGLTLIPGNPNPPAFRAAINELYQTDENARAEIEDQGLVAIAWLPLSAILVANERIGEPSDLSGKDIRGNPGAGIITALEMVGANNVALPITELNQGLERGVVDGSWTTGLDVAVSLGLDEVSSYWTDPEFGAFGTATILMQLEEFESLPEELQQLVVDIGLEAQHEYARSSAQVIEEACGQLDEAGVTVYEMDQTAAYDEWRSDVAEAQINDWSDLASERGVEPDDYYAGFQALYDSFDQEMGPAVNATTCIQ